MNQITKFIQIFPSIDYGEKQNDIDENSSKIWLYSLQNEFRLYQFTIVQSTFYYNTMVCLPTGLGKTFIASMAILNFSRWFPKGKIFFLAPTRPLVAQQQEAMKKFGIDGKLSKNDRTYQSQIYFSTPQTLENDLNEDLIQNIVLVVLDEAHKGVGDYAYTNIVKRLLYNTRIIALSATPGNNLEQIQQVVANLRIAKIELKDENDPEVVPYLKFKSVEKIVVSFDNCEILDQLNKQIQPLLNVILSFGILPVELIRVCSRANIFSYGACFKLREFLKNSQLQFQIGQPNSNKVFEHLSHLHKLSYAKKILLEQGIQPYVKYMELDDIEEVHPKIYKLKEICKNHFAHNESKVIIFTNSRDNAQLLCNHINQVENVKASIFVGQASTKNQAGMKQKEQLQVIDKFKKELNVLVATCIAEEGLDIGEVDLIICYDSGFSPIRMIQRMGRTGRKRDGKIIVLLTEGKEAADYEKSVNKYSKLIKELKEFNINLYSSNPRILISQPQIQFIDGDINSIEIKIKQQDSIQTKNKDLKKQKRTNKNTEQQETKQIKLEKFFTKNSNIISEETEEKQQTKQLYQPLLLSSSSITKPKKVQDKKIQLTKIDQFIKPKQLEENAQTKKLKIKLQTKQNFVEDQFTISTKLKSIQQDEESLTVSSLEQLNDIVKQKQNFNSDQNSDTMFQFLENVDLEKIELKSQDINENDLDLSKIAEEYLSN
ncbi:unnamed protein product [Paramecium sonneborni]|uniref:ATP-dependent DNA helicase n=1 Tax=Paramecium sonneborni TaxID=65129 RepID=A0A8S1QGF2_9CILI|nr:unnamed protein product [Paramecium sonneborni]